MLDNFWRRAIYLRADGVAEGVVNSTIIRCWVAFAASHGWYVAFYLDSKAALLGFTRFNLNWVPY